MDFYRMVHQKSFYITMSILLFLFAWHLCADIRSSVIFAQFDHRYNTVVDFLYYFPKSVFFLIGTLVYLALFAHEEYTSGFVKYMYPLQQKKWMILLEKWIFSLLVYFCFWACSLILTLFINLFLKDPLIGFSLMDYMAYSVTQAILLTAVVSFLMLLNHSFQSKIATTLVACAYGSYTIFALHAGIHMLLPEGISYLEYTLSYISGTLPTTWDASVYSSAFAIAFSSTILYNGISYLVLKKKDIA